MEDSITISDRDSLNRAADQMHDCGFKISDVFYDPQRSLFSIKAREYVYEGRFIQRQTDKTRAVCVLTLYHVERCEIVEKDKEGYETVGEDYFNLIKFRNSNRLTIKTAFHEIILRIAKFEGLFEYSKAQEG